MQKLSRGLSDRMRRNSFTGVSSDLNYDELEQLLLQVASHAEDRDIAAAVRESFAGLAARCHARGTGIGKADELNEVVNMFGAILTSARGLPPRYVGQVHSFVGMIRAKQKRFDCAIRSFLKALWLQTSTTDTPVLDTAITQHRLGMAYGDSKNFAQAISLLEKSLQDYERAKMKAEHSCILAAQSALLDFRSQYMQQKLQNQKKYGKYTTSLRRLGHIQEEREYHSERGYQSERLLRW